MSDLSYERLADALDALPNGFPRMPSRIDIRILEKSFGEEEADLAGHMSREYETVKEIAARAGLDEVRATQLLDTLLPTDLVKRKRQDGVRLYASAGSEQVHRLRCVRNRLFHRGYSAATCVT